MDDAARCAAALVTHPETVRGVHEEYVRAGADFIITNTVPTSRHVLEPPSGTASASRTRSPWSWRKRPGPRRSAKFI
jgi:S-methylmethionine-dependent homocysteine/selenocysteine methylase